MRKLFILVSLLCGLLYARSSQAQCGSANAVQLNWDRLEYYYNSGTNTAPYGTASGTYVTNAMEQVQKFAIGTNTVTFDASAAGIVKGENALHTGDVSANYSGEDAQFTPSAALQTLKLTFEKDITNLNFTLYDVDLQQRIDFSAKNSSGIPQNVGLANYSSSIVSLGNNNTALAYVSAANTALTNSDNRGTVTVTVSGTIRSITLTFTTLGTDPTFWISDLNACDPSNFPASYNQTGDNRPLQSAVADQPDYFLITPDNTSIYMVDPVSGKAYFLFSDPEFGYINSLAYDPYKHVLFYVTEHYPAVATNKKLKKYDFNTSTSSTVIADITTTLNIPTFDQSIEGAGAAFYDGDLYLGIEGGRFSNTSSRESAIYRITFDASYNVTNVAQVFAIPSYSGTTMLHDWADFVIKDGILYNLNSQTGTTKVSYEHYNLMTGTSTKYLNPGSTAYASQAAVDWNKNLYTVFTNGIAKYNENGTFGTIVPITAVTGGPWPGGAGDASENFRPQVDFGDAPSSYDPSLSPAAHSDDANLRLGSAVDKEWITKGQTSLANSDADDGIPTVTVYNPISYSYLTYVNVYNNTGANATLCAWLDYNGNGTFEASEGVTYTIPSSASVQNQYLYWNSLPATLATGTYTYLRVRVTYGTSGMTTAHPTGYFPGGEVEDYRVSVNNWPLAVQQTDLAGKLTASKTVKLSWASMDETDVAGYTIERSLNSVKWETVAVDQTKKANGPASHEVMDPTPVNGIVYYRLKTNEMNGRQTISNIIRIDNRLEETTMSIAPNPARGKAQLFVSSAVSGKANMEIVNAQGAMIYQEQVQLTAGTSAIQLPVVRLAAGRYVVRLETASGLVTSPLIVGN